MRHALSGAAEAGLSTTVLPQISAGASFQAGIALGKFQGVTRPTTPIGFRSANICTLARSEGARIPKRRDPSPAKYRKILIDRRTSPFDSGSVLPSSRVMSVEI